MILLPYEKITYQSSLDITEVQDRLDNIIEPKKMIRNTSLFGGGNNKPYEGVITDQSFKVSRIIGYRNSFLPIISGHITSYSTGTRISIKMKLHPLVLIFMLFWTVGVSFACITVIYSMNKNEAFNFFSLVPFGMLIFGIVLTLVGFKVEGRKSKKDFAELFEATYY